MHIERRLENVHEELRKKFCVMVSFIDENDIPAELLVAFAEVLHPENPEVVRINLWLNCAYVLRTCRTALSDLLGRRLLSCSQLSCFVG